MSQWGARLHIVRLTACNVGSAQARCGRLGAHSAATQHEPTARLADSRVLHTSRRRSSAALSGLQVMTVHVALHLRATLTALERPRVGEALSTRGGALGAGATRRRQRPRLVSPLIFWGSMETMHWDAQAHAETCRLGGAIDHHPWLREAPPPQAPSCTRHSGRAAEPPRARWETAVQP